MGPFHRHEKGPKSWGCYKKNFEGEKSRHGGVRARYKVQLREVRYVDGKEKEKVDGKASSLCAR